MLSEVVIDLQLGFLCSRQLKSQFNSTTKMNHMVAIRHHFMKLKNQITTNYKCFTSNSLEASIQEKIRNDETYGKDVKNSMFNTMNLVFFFVGLSIMKDHSKCNKCLISHVLKWSFNLILKLLNLFI